METEGKEEEEEIVVAAVKNTATVYFQYADCHEQIALSLNQIETNCN